VADWLGDILVVPIGSADVEEREVGSEFRRAIKLDGRLRATLDFVAGPADQSSQGLCQAAVDSPRTSVNNRTRSTSIPRPFSEGSIVRSTHVSESRTLVIISDGMSEPLSRMATTARHAPGPASRIRASWVRMSWESISTFRFVGDEVGSFSARCSGLHLTEPGGMTEAEVGDESVDPGADLLRTPLDVDEVSGLEHHPGRLEPLGPVGARANRGFSPVQGANSHDDLARTGAKGVACSWRRRVAFPVRGQVGSTHRPVLIG
jgi:hypothetical protein